LTKLHNNELPSVKAADLVNCVVLASVYTYEQFVSYRTVICRVLCLMVYVHLYT